jgi:hypothetical protein
MDPQQPENIPLLNVNPQQPENIPLLNMNPQQDHTNAPYQGKGPLGHSPGDSPGDSPQVDFYEGPSEGLFSVIAQPVPHPTDSTTLL